MAKFSSGDPQQEAPGSFPFSNIQIQDGSGGGVENVRVCGFRLNPTASICRAGKWHMQEGSGHYAIPHNVPSTVVEVARSWRHCTECQGSGGKTGQDRVCALLEDSTPL